MKGRILIVEDQYIEANNLRRMLVKAGYEVIGIARSVEIALQMIEEEVPSFVLVDIFLQGSETGIDLAKKLQARKIPFIYLSANSNADTLAAAKATRPYGFLVKPFHEKDVLVMLEIAEYLHLNNSGSSTAGSVNPTQPLTEGNFYGIIGKSARLLSMLKLLKVVAPTDTSVLILGESGTGKERVAECIHELSPRASKALIKINCAALPISLIESTLFGHEKGSFTGASDRRIGKFEMANKGTIFLDEIGTLPLDVQAKLLRVLQEREIERVGGHQTIKVDVRIVAATNSDLELEVAKGNFRMDLYYRLQVFPLQLPALRDRKEDIPMLVDYFIDYYASRMKHKVIEINENSMEKLLKYEWPGNIRELRHVIERAVVVGEQPVIPNDEISSGAISKPPGPKSFQTIDEVEREHIKAVLISCGGKISGPGGAAEVLQIPATTLQSKIKRLGIKKNLLF